MKKWICMLLALVLLGSLLPLDAAAIDLIDTGRAVSVTVISKYDGMALVGEQFDLYKVADADEECNMTPTEAFRPYISGDLNKVTDWKKLNKTLYEALLASPEKFEVAYTGKTNDKGELKLSVNVGLYLIVGKPHIQSNRQFTQNSILVMLPNRPKGQEVWEYSVNVYTKPQEPVDARKIRIIKIWDDENNAYRKRPKTLDVYIVNEAGGKLGVTLPYDGKWEYTWDDHNGLEYGHTWKAYEKEKQLNGYELVSNEVNVNEKDEITFILTNRYREEPPEEPKLPQTGQLWWPVPVLLSLGMLCILVGMIRRRGEKHEG